jgi:protein O-mannosyl-transferase
LKKSRAILAVCCLLTALTLACYWPVAGHSFVSLDDHRYISENPQVQSGLAWTGVAWAFGTGYAGNWHPLTWISHMLDCQLYGVKPAGHHLTNLLFHIANTLLLCLLLQRMTGALWRSAAVAALFAWHPLRVESVAWAAERKDVLSTFFFLLTLWAYVRYVEKAKARWPKAEFETPGLLPPEPGPRSMLHAPHSTFYLLSLVLFALGLMCKPMLVTLPFVLLLLDYWPLQRLEPGTKSSRFNTLLPFLYEKLPFFVLALAASIVTYVVQQRGGAVSSLELISVQSRIANALVAYVRYLYLTLWPAHLCVLYPYSRQLAVGAVIAAVLLLAGLSWCFLWRARRQPFLSVGWLWFLGTLVPTIGLVQVGSQAMADRYTYIPSIGLFLLVVWGAEAVVTLRPGGGRLVAVAGVAALAACMVCTRVQLPYWKDSESLYRRAIAVTRDNYVAYDGLGSALEAKGLIAEALAAYSESVRLKPRYPDGHYDLGTALMRQGKLDEAIRHLAAAVEAKPAFAHAHINLGKALLEQGKLDQAAVHFGQAVRLTPDDPEAQYNLGTLLLMQGSLDPAIGALSEALRLKAGYGEAHGNLGIAFMRQGKPEQGAAHFAAAVRLNAGDPEARFNLGLALLELNRPGEAAGQFSESLRLRPDSPVLHYHLALALVRQGKEQEALAHARNARDLAQAAGQVALAAEAEALLRQSQR